MILAVVASTGLNVGVIHYAVVALVIDPTQQCNVLQEFVCVGGGRGKGSSKFRKHVIIQCSQKRGINLAYKFLEKLTK